MYKYVTSFPKNMHLFLKNRAILGIKKKQPANQPTAPIMIKYIPAITPAVRGVATKSRNPVKQGVAAPKALRQ